MPSRGNRLEAPVSTTRYGLSPMRARPKCRSRVKPGKSATSAARVRVSRLNSVDLPTFGRPTRTRVGSMEWVRGSSDEASRSEAIRQRPLAKPRGAGARLADADREHARPRSARPRCRRISTAARSPPCHRSRTRPTRLPSLVSSRVNVALRRRRRRRSRRSSCGPPGRRLASLSCFQAEAPVVLSRAWIAPAVVGDVQVASTSATMPSRLDTSRDQLSVPRSEVEARDASLIGDGAGLAARRRTAAT